MLQYLVNLIFTAYFEVAILMILLVEFFTHRQDPSLVVSSISVVRTVIAALIFSFLMLIWASDIPTRFRSISIFGMFLVNLFLYYHYVLARLERPYRDALTAITQDLENYELIHDIWHKGKRIYYLRHVWLSLFSRTNPLHFLHAVAIDRVRDDIKSELRRYGVQRKLISLSMMAKFLKSQLASDENLPEDFKDLMSEAIDDFANHPWIEEHANTFLQRAMEAPEDLHFPEWMKRFEPYVKAYKKEKPPQKRV